MSVVSETTADRLLDGRAGSVGPGLSDRGISSRTALIPARGAERGAAAVGEPPCDPGFVDGGAARHCGGGHRRRSRVGSRAPRGSGFGSGCGQGLGVGGVERLHAGLVVAVEWRDAVDPGRRGAEVVVGGVGEPHADLVEVDAVALAVDDLA
jgi:hypothetical protein